MVSYFCLFLLGLIGSVRSILLDELRENDKPGLFITCGGNLVRCNLMTQFCDPHTSSCHDCEPRLSGTTELADEERDALHNLCSGIQVPYYVKSKTSSR